MMNNGDLTTLDIVYNGEKLSLDRDEAVKLAQKGMNYDRVLDKYNNIRAELEKADSYKNKIDELAKEAGTTPENIISLLDSNIKEMKVTRYSENENIPQEYAEKMMNLTKEIESLKKEKEELLPLKKKQEERAEFLKEYPGVDIAGLDKEILDKWESSEKSLTDIYNSVMLKKLINKKEADIANEYNRNASSGSVRDASMGEKIYTDDDIRKMPYDELKRKFKTLARQLDKKEMNN